MGAFNPDEVNRGFQRFCPELDTPIAQYPFQHDRWLNFTETYNGQPVFKESEINEGVKVGYVWCKNAPLGPGYYHVLCKPSNVNLYSRLVAEGPPAGSFCKPDTLGADLWDTVKRVLYARSRCSKPDDGSALEQQVDHMVGTKLNPVYGLKV